MSLSEIASFVCSKFECRYRLSLASVTVTLPTVKCLKSSVAVLWFAMSVSRYARTGISWYSPNGCTLSLSHASAPSTVTVARPPSSSATLFGEPRK